ncbi:TlpA family protein disulfide reductase [Deinococcus maricopensis]|uniref:Alkyl hydroperoxide reductase/ Thiol specific antioxidant/ Mal allergen n=1 Tax=Deinococcus maricopensis (strain DSM 21211 / LMG 22137 / NRRL B-23946 / LB-34) TaxID=709986 RepID=E8U6W1_DEIML|nr:TlpA disulfide reductase family protein [Deinococcus maricopensis]ADV66800.1 alkyl hydroperoxide reductase/ Thiol specific antioxidant/ Mal allergen [Deinococcus maricopensis DSM 21211]
MTTSPSSPPAVPTWRRLLPPALAFLLVVVFAVALTRQSDSARTGATGPLVGKAAPNFTLKDLNGNTVTLASLRGRPVLLNFWASWCPPCRNEAPLLSDVARQQRAQGLAIVGVIYADDNVSALRDFIGEYNLAYPNVRDPGSRIAIDYGVAAVPETFFIDKTGVIRAHVRQEVTRDVLTRQLKTIGVSQ